MLTIEDMVDGLNSKCLTASRLMSSRKVTNNVMYESSLTLVQCLQYAKARHDITCTCLICVMDNIRLDHLVDQIAYGQLHGEDVRI